MGLLGYSTISLTDLTEVLPASLYLSSSLVSNAQTKEGDNYTPDFSQDGNEVIITPSFFVGTSEVVKKEGETDCPYKDNIRYTCGDISRFTGEIVYSFANNSVDSPVWVDNKARLHYKKNLIKSITVKAWIEGWTDDASQTSYPNVPALNPINILLLTENSGYSAFMTSVDGREHFEEGNEAAIVLEASVYDGANKITEGNVYTWYQASVYEINESGEKVLTPLSETSNRLTIQRKSVKTLDTFICEITIENGLKFRVSMNILDKTDTYFGNIISNGSLILTPEHGSVSLTCQLWSGTTIINEGTSDRFNYEWFYLKDGSTEAQSFGGDSRQVIVDLSAKKDGTEELLFSKENFAVYCRAKVDNKVYVVSNVSIQYSPVIYSVQKKPETFFVPSMSGGGYYSSEKTFSQDVIFSLIGSDGQPLTYDTADSFPSFVASDISPFSATVSSMEEGKWKFKITFSYDPKNDEGQSKFRALGNSFYLTFHYTYLGVLFQDEYVGVKNEAGENGTPAYTVYLDNEFVSFSADKLGDLASSEQVYKITPYAFLGANEKVCKIDGEIISTDGIKAEKITSTSGVSDYVNVSIDKNNISALLNKLNGSISVKIKVDDLTFIRNVTYSVRFSSISYYLNLSESSFMRDMANTFSPSQIIVSAMYKREGQDATYSCTSGYMSVKMYGSGGTEIAGMESELSISASNNKIIVNSNVLNTSVKYLIAELKESKASTEILDRQTIPVLVDNGDIEVGGVNLLRYTREMPSRNIGKKDYWQLSNCTIQEVQEEDASAVFLSYDGTEQWQSTVFFQSLDRPLEGFSEYYTLSFDINSADYAAMNNELCFTQSLHCVDGLRDSRWRWRDTTILKDVALMNGARVINGSLENGSWARVAYTFSPKMKAEYFNITPETPSGDYTFENVKYIGFAFWCRNTCNLKIKKIKLEKGNIPTDWNESPYDVNYEDIRGTNLLPAYFQTKVYSKANSEGTEWSVDFKKGDYTLSWDSNASSSTNSQTILRANKYLTDGVDFKATNSYTFHVDEDDLNSEFVLYTAEDTGDDYYTMIQLKLEKGVVATPYALSTEQIQQYYKDYLTGSDGVVKNIIVTDTDGSIHNIFADDFANYTDSINDLNAKYTTLSSEYTSLVPTKTGFDEWKSYYEIGKDENNRSVLTLGDKTPGYDVKVKLSSTKMAFWDKDAEVAYISNDKLYINRAEIVKEMRIGASENTGYLVFKHMDGGLGVVWETK